MSQAGIVNKPMIESFSEYRQNTIMLYTSEDGKPHIQLRPESGMAYIAKLVILELFQTSIQNVTTHIRSIYDEGKLIEWPTCKESLQVDRKIYVNTTR